MPLSLHARPAWASTAVLYEVFVRSFTPEGSFRAVIPRLDELKTLGVTTLWLMPIFPVGEARKKGVLGSPYAVADYFAVHPALGTKEDFRALVEAVHARGMTIILDWVANHTAWDHPWVTAHPDWYRRDDQGLLLHPDGTDWTDVADLDYANRAMRQAMIEALRYWITEFDIDGYRCDVAGLVPLDFWAEAIPVLRREKPLLLLAEWETPEMHDAGFDMTYSWARYKTLKAIWRDQTSAQTLLDLVRSERRSFPDDALRLTFTTNHDETAWDDTPLGLFDGSVGARAAAVAMTLLPGTPLLYNGQEVASTQRLPLFEAVPLAWAETPPSRALRGFYATLLAGRAESEALCHGTLTPLDHDQPEAVLAFARDYGAQRAVVLVNTRPWAVTVTLAQTLRRPMLDLFSGDTVEGPRFRLGPYGFFVLR